MSWRNTRYPFGRIDNNTWTVNQLMHMHIGTEDPNHVMSELVTWMSCIILKVVVLLSYLLMLELEPAQLEQRYQCNCSDKRTCFVQYDQIMQK